MKLIYISLLFLLTIGCSNPSDKEEEVKVDNFREDVLKLSYAGMLKNIPAAKLDSVIDVYRKDSINGLKELLVASGELLKIHVSLDGRKLHEVYQKICDTIGMRYPELKCDEVQTFILPNKPRGNDTGSVVVKIRFGQTWYERKLYYFKHWEIDDFIYRIYNRKLADDGKLTRLHFVQYKCSECPKEQPDYMGATDVTRYGYLMLNKAQEDSLFMIPALEVEQEYEFSIYTTSQMNEQLAKFEASGLVNEIGTKWYENVKTDVMQSALYSQKDLHDFMDTLFSYTIFDTTNPVNPYEDILLSLAKISRGKFNPTAIIDEETNATTRNVQFTFEKDVYRFDAEKRGAFLFPGIIDNVNKALADHKAGGAFYTIATMDNACMLIYIDDDKVEKVKASGFFMQLEKGPSAELKSLWSSAAAL